MTVRQDVEFKLFRKLNQSVTELVRAPSINKRRSSPVEVSKSSWRFSKIFSVFYQDFCSVLLFKQWIVRDESQKELSERLLRFFEKNDVPLCPKKIVEFVYIDRRKIRKASKKNPVFLDF